MSECDARVSQLTDLSVFLACDSVGFAEQGLLGVQVKPLRLSKPPLLQSEIGIANLLLLHFLDLYIFFQKVGFESQLKNLIVGGVWQGTEEVLDNFEFYLNS